MFKRKQKAPLKYNTSFTNITLPAMPGLLLEVSCQVRGYPIPNLKWIVDGVNYNERKFEILNDEPFVINIPDKNASLVNNILVMKIDSPKKPIKYECILNDNITIRTNYIEIIGNAQERIKKSYFGPYTFLTPGLDFL